MRRLPIKREDLNHTGSHKINNVLGQALLAKRMGVKRVIAETGAGQHGVATATVCAMFGMECIIYMGAEDMKRQSLNVFRIELLGAKVVAVDKGQGRLKDAVDEALNDLIANYKNTFYLLGSAVGPHPFPTMVKHFQSIVSEESKRQILAKENRLPDAVIACVGGGSNAIGAFAHYLDEKEVRIIGIEPEQAPTLTEGVPGVIHGFKCLVLLDEEGNPRKTYSIAAGLDYPGIGPEHSNLKETGRAEYYTVTNEEVLEAFQMLSKTEGIIPALESAHAVAYTIKMAPQMSKDQIVIVNLSGRGDKDVEQVFQMLK
jgi:tryptophan synthase beta chain